MYLYCSPGENKFLAPPLGTLSFNTRSTKKKSPHACWIRVLVLRVYLKRRPSRLRQSKRTPTPPIFITNISASALHLLVLVLVELGLSLPACHLGLPGHKPINVVEFFCFWRKNKISNIHLIIQTAGPMWYPCQETPKLVF